MLVKLIWVFLLSNRELTLRESYDDFTKGSGVLSEKSLSISSAVLALLLVLFLKWEKYLSYLAFGSVFILMFNELK